MARLAGHTACLKCGGERAGMKNDLKILAELEKVDRKSWRGEEKVGGL